MSKNIYNNILQGSRFKGNRLFPGYNSNSQKPTEEELKSALSGGHTPKVVSAIPAQSTGEKPQSSAVKTVNTPQPETVKVDDSIATPEAPAVVEAKPDTNKASNQQKGEGGTPQRQIKTNDPTHATGQPMPLFQSPQALQYVYNNALKDEGTWLKESNEKTWKAIIASSADLRADILAGLAEMPEKALDFLVTAAQYNAQAQYYMNGGAYQSPEQQSAAQGTFDAGKDWAAEFVQKDLYSGEKIAETVITKPTENIWNMDVEKASVFGEKTDALAQSAGQLLGTAAFNGLGIPWWFTTALTSAGGQTEKALNEGANLDEAALSGIIAAGAEVLTEKISGGIKFGGKTLDEGLSKMLAEGITNKYIRALAKFGIETTGEGFEEVITQDIGTFGEWLAYQKEKDLLELLFSEEAMKEKIDAFIGGTLLSGTTNLGKAAGSLVNSISKKPTTDSGNAGKAKLSGDANSLPSSNPTLFESIDTSIESEYSERGYHRLEQEPRFERSSRYVEVADSDINSNNALYHYINNPQNTVAAEYVKQTATGQELSMLQKLTPEEIARYNYIKIEKGDAQAALYLKTLESDLQKRNEAELDVAESALEDTVLLPDGKIGTIKEGSDITKVVTFAGKGTSKPVKIADWLSEQYADYNVDPSEWKKTRGDGYVVCEGNITKHAELHWFESEATGRVRMKVKRFFDDES